MMVLDLRATARDLELLPAEVPWTLIQGKALATLKTLPDGLADALITDESYSSGGMMRSDRTASPIEREPYFIETSCPRLERAAAYRALTEGQRPSVARLAHTSTQSTTAPVVWRWRTNKEQPHQ